MGSVFAVQVETGFEIKAKEMLSHVFKKDKDSLVKSIYALETHTELLKENQNRSINSELTEDDIQNHIKRKEIRAQITNKRRQLETISRYNTKKYKQIKAEYRKEINELEKKFKNIGCGKKKIKSVLSGYLLIELKVNSLKLPAYLWHMIKDVPLVRQILSLNPIPEHELEIFAKTLEEALEPKVEFALQSDPNEEEILATQSKLVKKLNHEKHTREQETTIINKIDSAKEKILEKVKSFLRSKKKENASSLNKIKLFTAKNQQIVNLPLSVFYILYPNKEVQFISGRVNSKDFLYRLKKVFLGKEVTKCY